MRGESQPEAAPTLHESLEGEQKVPLLCLAPYCAALSTGPGSIWRHLKETTRDNPTTIRPVQKQQHSLLGTQSNRSSLVKTED